MILTVLERIPVEWNYWTDKSSLRTVTVVPFFDSEEKRKGLDDRARRCG